MIIDMYGYSLIRHTTLTLCSTCSIPYTSISEPSACMPYRVLSPSSTYTKISSFWWTESLLYISIFCSVSSQQPTMEGIQASISSYSSFPLKTKQVGHLVAEEAEINIFDAERYFSEGQEKESKKPDDRDVDKCDVSTIPRFSSVSSADGYGRNYRSGSFNATPTASSEASWNSQSGLLSNPPGSIAVSMRNLRFGASKKKEPSRNWFFRRRCPCSGKKSVQVEEKCSEVKISVKSHCDSNASLSPRVKESSKEISVEKPKGMEKKSLGIDHDVNLVTVNSKREEQEVIDGDSQDRVRYPDEDPYPAEIGHRVVPSGRAFGDGGGFSFPILNPPTPPPSSLERILSSSIGRKMNNNNLEEPPRESLEVFQPADESLAPEKVMGRGGLIPLREDISRQSFNFPTSPKIPRTTHINDVDDDGDVMSDASSDLFEIESFSTQSTVYPMMYRQRDSLDELSSFDGRRYGLGRRSLDETTTTATPSIAPTECYEPSEASIDWSVTTAEGFAANFSCSVSECQYPETDHARKVALNGAKRRGNGGLLMSCICEKAVNVGPHPVRSMTERQNQQHYGTSAQPYPVESSRILAASMLSSMNQVATTRSHSDRISRSLTTH